MVTAALVIAGFAVGGRQVLGFLDVSVPALQGAGGLLLLLVALQLSTSDDDDAEAAPIDHVAVAMVPLGTPLLAGPDPARPATHAGLLGLPLLLLA